MADTKKKPAAKSGKSKRQAIKTSRQAKETKRGTRKATDEE